MCYFTYLLLKHILSVKYYSLLKLTRFLKLIGVKSLNNFVICFMLFKKKFFVLQDSLDDFFI